MLNEDISMVITLFRHRPYLSDLEIYKTLVSKGVEKQRAARLVEFLPIVFNRLILAKNGIKFPNTFRQNLTDGGFFPEKEITSMPIWQEIFSFAQEEITRGASRQDILTLAMRSPEFVKINEQLKSGSKFKNIVLKQLQLYWPEEGPF